MLGSMNRIFPGGRYYSPLVGGPLKYLVVLLARLFMITGSVFVPGLFHIKRRGQLHGHIARYFRGCDRDNGRYNRYWIMVFNDSQGPVNAK